MKHAQEDVKFGRRLRDATTMIPIGAEVGMNGVNEPAFGLYTVSVRPSGSARHRSAPLASAVAASPISNPSSFQLR
jgi:hypothetical protein